MKFDKDKVLHPFTPDDIKKKYEGRKGWYSDYLEVLQNNINTVPIYNCKKMLLNNSMEFSFELSGSNFSYRYFYPAPEPEYRPFNEEEMRDMVGTIVMDKIKKDRYIVTHYIDADNVVIVDSCGHTPMSLFQVFTFTDGTPCGVKIK